jgi:hypothetical protein
MQDALELEELDFFRHSLTLLSDAEVPYLVGGAYALERYTGVIRRTKDVDIFVRPHDCDRVLEVLGDAGYGTELTDPMWLAKAFHKGYLLDIIFSSGNGMCTVDDFWFAHARTDEVLGINVKLCPAEEMLWQKMYIMERERFDGADVAHLIRELGPNLDWHRLIRRMDQHWEVMLAHLVLFDFIYPGERESVPRWVNDELLGRLREQLDAPTSSEDRRLCRGTLLSRYQYLGDLRHWEYRDARPRLPIDAAA